MSNHSGYELKQMSSPKLKHVCRKNMLNATVLPTWYALGSSDLLAGGRTANSCSNGRKGWPMSNSMWMSRKPLMSDTYGA